MSLKAKLVSTVAAFVMVLALMVVGVLAASQGTIQMGGSIQFTASDVIADVSLTSTGMTSNLNKTASYTATTETIQETWTDLNLTFVEGTDIQVSLKVENNATDRPLYVTFTDLPEITTANNVTVTGVTYGDSQNVEEGVAVPITATESETFVFTFAVTDDNNGASGRWTANVKLSNNAA